MFTFKKKQAPQKNRGPQLVSDSAPFEYAEAYNAFRTNFNFVTMNAKFLTTKNYTCIFMYGLKTEASFKIL